MIIDSGLWKLDIHENKLFLLETQQLPEKTLVSQWVAEIIIAFN